MALQEVIEEAERTPENLIGNVPGISREEFRIETDANGQNWAVYADGRRLKRGHNQSPGRPPKQVREDTLRGVSRHALPWAMRVMDNEKIPDDSPAKARAAEILFRFGLGTKDEVQMANHAQVIQAIAKVAASLKLDSKQAEALVQGLADELGIE